MKQCVPAEIEKRNRGSPRSVSTSLMSGNSSLRLVHELCVAADGGIFMGSHEFTRRGQKIEREKSWSRINCR